MDAGAYSACIKIMQSKQTKGISYFKMKNRQNLGQTVQAWGENER